MAVGWLIRVTVGSCKAAGARSSAAFFSLLDSRECLVDHVGDPRRSLPIPQRRGAVGPGADFIQPGKRLEEIAGPESDGRVGAVGQRAGTLGVLAQRQARHFQNRGFFLDSARVGEDGPDSRHPVQELQIAQPGGDL